MTNCIEVRGLCKAFDGFALKDVSFALPGGCIMGLIGENGAGKTTTLKCLLGLLRRDGGDISLLGCDPWDQPRRAKAEVGAVLDDCFFHDSLRPRDVSAILAPVFPSWDDGLFRDYLDKFQLPEKKTVKELSRGMKMKLSLAAALAHRPRLLILDEATAGLDPVVRDSILELAEYHRFSKGIFAWVGYSTKFIPYTACERATGTTKWSFWKLVNYAIEGIIGFSTAPLRLATWLGGVTGVAAVIYLIVVVLQKLIQGIDVPGYATIIVLILLLGSVQLFCIGIIGEYVGRTFEQSKDRPIYIAKEVLDYEQN